MSLRSLEPRPAWKTRSRNKFDELRKTEFSRLDSKCQTYLDYTGSGLYPESLISAYGHKLRNQVYGNPHSENPTSRAATNVVDETRNIILRYFNASPVTYCVVFTANATAAIKLVAESFPFQPSSAFALLADNHNSVHGIREYVEAAGASVHYIPIDEQLRASGVQQHLSGISRHTSVNHSLFAYPAQSNFSGVKHSLSYVTYAQALGWTVLLDGAAYVPTSELDLSAVQPDFLAISFYKMFGFPTGVGALIARRSSLEDLKRQWFAGGTVAYAGVANQVHVLKRKDPAAFEDGTLNFLSIAAVKDGLTFLSSVGIREISDHVMNLTSHCFGGFDHLQYKNGKPVVRVYGPVSSERRGACIAFDILDSHGNRVNASEVEEAANRRNISLRTGCFCNPGAAEFALQRDVFRERSCLEQYGYENVNLQNMSKCLGEYLGCVRVSFGWSTNLGDVETFLLFIHDYAMHL